MAIPGIGYRTVADVLMEISFHLAQPAVYQNSSGSISPGLQTVTVASTYAMYPGAMLVVETPGSSGIEVITVETVPSLTTFTATFANSHASGVAIWGATFPTQEATDPIFTQSEMLQYLSRAQNEFLTAVPCNYQRFFQTVNTGLIYQATPPTAVLIDRVAASPYDVPIDTMVRYQNQVMLSPVNGNFWLPQYATFAVVGATDPSFDGVFSVTTSSGPGEPYGGGGYSGGGFGGGSSMIYRQVGPDTSTTGGFMQSMLRLYEVTQEELVMSNRNWQSNYVGPLQSWFEDRSGLYRWGVGGRPSSNFQVELLCAIRDTDTLSLLDGFLVPDVCLHGVKWLSMNYIWSKNGVASQPQMADFALKRYSQVVMATQRYIQAMKMSTGRQ